MYSFSFTKRGFIIFLFTIFIIFANSTSSNAENGYCSQVKVLEVGSKVEGTVSQPRNIISLLNTRDDCGDWPKNTSKWFYLADNNRDALMAAAITSMSLDTSVRIVVTGSNKYVTWDNVIFLAFKAPIQ